MVKTAQNAKELDAEHVGIGKTYQAAPYMGVENAAADLSGKAKATAAPLVEKVKSAAHCLSENTAAAAVKTKEAVQDSAFKTQKAVEEGWGKLSGGADSTIAAGGGQNTIDAKGSDQGS